MRQFDPIKDSDGCSGFWSYIVEKFTGKCPTYEGACVIHDRAYYYGGPTALRQTADRELMKAVIDKGHPVIAFIMYLGVRLGGHQYIPFPSIKKVEGKWRWNGWNAVRWGYGFPYPQYKD